MSGLESESDIELIRIVVDKEPILAKTLAADAKITDKTLAKRMARLCKAGYAMREGVGPYRACEKGRLLAAQAAKTPSEVSVALGKISESFRR